MYKIFAFDSNLFLSLSSDFIAIQSSLMREKNTNELKYKNRKNVLTLVHKFQRSNQASFNFKLGTPLEKQTHN